jgi:hypothetical protein
MDWTMIDLTHVPEPAIGDKVTLIGSENDLSIRAEDLAGALDTISYEITCGISARVPAALFLSCRGKAERHRMKVFGRQEWKEFFLKL